MPAKVYTDKDADLKHLQNKTLAVLGFGSQGHAHALNLKDSGCKVIIGLYEGSKSIPVAQSNGFEVMSTAEAVRRGFKVRACEPSRDAAQRFAQRMGFDPDPTFFDFDYAQRNSANFDVAILSHVLEHIPDPDLFVQNIRTVLKPGGSLIVAVPLFGSILTPLMGKKDFFVTPPTHLNYFSLAGLTGLLNRHGFQVAASYTSPKVNMERYKSSLGPMRYAVNIGGYLVLKGSEIFHRSVVLNVCAKRN